MTQNQIAFAKLQEEKYHNRMTEMVDMGNLSEKKRGNDITSWHYGTIDPATAAKDYQQAGYIAEQAETERQMRMPKVEETSASGTLKREQAASESVLRTPKKLELDSSAYRNNMSGFVSALTPTIEREKIAGSIESANIGATGRVASSAISSLSKTMDGFSQISY